MNEIRHSFEEAKRILDVFLAEENNINRISEAGEMMAKSLRSGGKLISCGNGGSMCDAMHFAEELTGRYRDDRKPLAALSISDPSYITCTANDYGFEKIFSRFIEAHGNNGDVLLAISTSGNSANVIEAAGAARQKGMGIVTLTGQDGGKLAHISDIELRVAGSVYADRTQEIHIKIIHSLLLYIEKNL